MFWVGFFGSIINNIGLICIQNAYATGPAGPASSIAAMSSLLLVITEAIKTKKMLNSFELLGFISGVLGALILTIPDTLQRLFCSCTSKPTNDKTKQNA